MKLALVLVLAVTFTTGLAEAKSTSEYTSLDNCKLLASSEDDVDAPIDYFSSVCEGRDGLAVHFAGGDSRSWISLIKAGTKPEINSTNSSLDGLEQGGFPNIAGSKLEWRYRDGNLDALIVRVEGQDQDDFKKFITTLTVMRVGAKDKTEACVIGLVNARDKHANAKARQLADSSATCRY